MQYDTIQNMFIFLTHATYTMRLNTLQLMQHNVQKAIHAMPHDTTHATHTINAVLWVNIST